MHKRPVEDRAVCGFAAVDIAAVLWLAPKHFAAIQLPRMKRSFPKPRAASGWLLAAAFHPTNPQAEASAKFLVPFSKKGTSFYDGTPRPRTPRHTANATVYTLRVPRTPRHPALATRSRVPTPHATRAITAPATATPSAPLRPALYSAHHGIRLHSLREALTRYDSRLPAPCTPHHTASAVAYAFPTPANRPLSTPKTSQPRGFPRPSVTGPLSFH